MFELVVHVLRCRARLLWWGDHRETVIPRNMDALKSALKPTARLLKEYSVVVARYVPHPPPAFPVRVQWISCCVLLFLTALVLISDALLLKKIRSRSPTVAMAWVCMFCAGSCWLQLNDIYPTGLPSRSTLASGWFYLELSLLAPLIVYACGSIARTLDFQRFMLCTCAGEAGIFSLFYASMYLSFEQKVPYFLAAMLWGICFAAVLSSWAVSAEGTKILTLYMLLLLHVVPSLWLVSDAALDLVTPNQVRTGLNVARIGLIGASLLMLQIRGDVISPREKRRSLRKGRGD